MTDGTRPRKIASRPCDECGEVVTGDRGAQRYHRQQHRPWTHVGRRLAVAASR